MPRSPGGSNTELERPSSAEIGSLRLAPSASAASADHLAPAPALAPTQQAAPGKWDGLIKLASMHLSMIITGWSDASSGPLIPYIQVYYGISYTVVSMLFVGNMAGFLAAAGSNGWLSARFGLGRTVVAGAAIQALGFAFLVPAFPFPVMPVAYAISGFGLAVQLAQSNTYIGGLPSADHHFAFLHASYGLGAVIVPLAATSFVNSGVKFSYFYGISVGIGCSTLHASPTPSS